MKRIILIKERQRQFAYEQIAQTPLGGEFEVVIRKFQKVRSTDQNALYWKYLEVIGRETGHDKESLHEYFRKRYGYWQNKDVFGIAVAVPVSTTKYTTKRFTEYLNQVEAEASAMGVVLPHPSDAWMEDGILLQ